MSRMLQGVALGAAIRTALELKAQHQKVDKISQVKLGEALGMTQPSVSELLKMGRLAKEKLPLLLDYFADVVGPDHFGLPISKAEMELLKDLRRLPSAAQAAVAARVRESAQAVSAATALLDLPLESSYAKPLRTGTA